MSRAGVAWAWVVSLALIGTNLFFIIGNREAWPFSACPMFGHPHHPQQLRYQLTWHVVDAAGARALSGRDIGQTLHNFGRFFFNHVWGSSDPRSLQGGFPNDTPAAL